VSRPAATDVSRDDTLSGTVESALAARTLIALKALYEERRGTSRRQKMARALIVVGVFCFLATGLEAAESWHFAMHALPLRVAATIICFAGAFLIGGVRTTWLEACCVAVPVISAMAITQALGEIAPERVADRYLIVAPIMVAAFVASIPVPFRAALVLCGAGVCCTTGVFAVSSGHLGLSANVDVTFFAAGVLAIAAALARRDEISRRRSFLFALRHELSAREMTRLNAKLLRLSSTDMLTGLANRRQLELELELLWLDHARTDLGVALIDVDHFKLFNDSAGHAAGDACLRAVANAVQGRVRHEADRVARYGGEEFVVLMPGVAAADLPALGDQLRRAVEDMAIAHPGQPGRNVTISVGLAWSAAAARVGPPDLLLRDADRALYAAKNAGRNRVMLADAINMAAE
jgi:diguanylate cyclase (GGDEF)-like protein